MLRQRHETLPSRLSTDRYTKIRSILLRAPSPSSDVRSTQDLTQNPSGYIVLRTESGNITESYLTAQDKENFAQVARYAQEHPIGPEVQAMATVGRGQERS